MKQKLLLKTMLLLFALIAGSSSVWADTWEEESLANLTSTDVFVIVGNNYAMTNDNGTGSAPAAVAVTVADGKITSAVTANIQWNVSGNATNGYTFYPNGSTTTWLYCSTTAASGSNNNIKVGTGTRKVFGLTTNSVIVTLGIEPSAVDPSGSDAPPFMPDLGPSIPSGPSFGPSFPFGL